VFQDFVAEGDAVVVQAESTGIEGVLHEAVLEAGFDDETSILNRTQNDLVTDEFLAATTGEDPRITYDLFAAETDGTLNERLGLPEDADPNDDLEEVLNVPFALDFTPDVDEVIAGQNDNGNLAEFFVAYEEFDENVFPAGDADELDDLVMADSLNFAAQAELEPTGGTQTDDNIPETVNPRLDANSLGAVTVEELDHVQRTIEIDDVHTFDGQLEVPGEANYSITGTSTAAPGTTVNMRVISDTGEGTPFAQEFVSIPTVAADEPGEPATFTQDVDFDETRDGVEIQAGTTFTADIDLAGADLNIVSIPGEVLADPAIETFEFNNQRGDGDVARIAEFDANRIAQIEIQNEAGDVLGTSDVLDRGTHTDFNIPLDPSIDENQELTAIATIVQPEVGDVLGEETAQINVEDDSEPYFDVRGLEPSTATVTQGDVIPAISAEVVNIGDIEDTQEITLEVGGTVIDDQELTLGGEESADVVFEDVDTGALDVGSFTHAIVSGDDDATGSLTVEAPDEPANFQIVGLSPSDATVTQGDTVVVDVTVQNVGDEDGTQTVELDINGIGFDESLTLAGGEADSVSFSVPTDDVEPGDYTHTVSTEDDSASGSLTVEEEEEEEDDDADDDGAGFGIAVAALALLGAALLAMRRQVE